MSAVNCDLTTLREQTEKIIVARYNEFELRDDLYYFRSKLQKARDTPDISPEAKSEIEQLISKVNDRLNDVVESISMDPNCGGGYCDYYD